MQIIGLYIESCDKKILKSLKEKQWYGFFSETNWHSIFEKKDSKKIKSEIKIIKNNQKFVQQLYNTEGYQLSLSGIVGKNGSGKSTLFDICNRIINNFTAYVKNTIFTQFNTEYKLEKTHEPLTTELYYENNGKIYSIIIHNDEIKFKNNETEDLFQEIKTLEDFSNHFFYTVSTSYSIYTEDSEWVNNLYHKNDGYFTPIVLVPFKEKGTININNEKKLAEKRVETLSVLLYAEGRDFIENYIPDRIEYTLRLYDEDYKPYIKEKCKKLLGKDKKNNRLKDAINKQWDIVFKNKNYQKINPYLRNCCKLYLQYKTLKICITYEVIAKKLFCKNGNLLSEKTLNNKIKKIIEKELWNENNLNYINLKILNCKRFMEYTYEKFYHNASGILIIDDFLKQFNAPNTYDKVFINLLPDFYNTKFFYKNKNTKDDISKIQLSQMSSGEQQLYNSLSYAVYHIKNAESNKRSNLEGRIPYKFFNLVFDEAELYYHPEYQRCFINNLVKLLNRSNLKAEGINILIATHSPFILSDIPTENIMLLEGGIVSNRIGRTLGANIYDLLQNQFFMNSSIGECSKRIIEEIIVLYNKKKKKAKKDLSFYYSFVERLGDDYLKTSLGYMLDEINGLTFEQKKINLYTRKISQIQK